MAAVPIIIIIRTLLRILKNLTDFFGRTGNPKNILVVPIYYCSTCKSSEAIAKWLEEWEIQRAENFHTTALLMKLDYRGKCWTIVELCYNVCISFCTLYFHYITSQVITFSIISISFRHLLEKIAGLCGLLLFLSTYFEILSRLATLGV